MVAVDQIIDPSREIARIDFIHVVDIPLEGPSSSREFIYLLVFFHEISPRKIMFSDAPIPRGPQ